MAENKSTLTYEVTTEEPTKIAETTTIKASAFEVGTDMVVFHMPWGQAGHKPIAAFPIKYVKKILMTDPPASPSA